METVVVGDHRSVQIFQYSQNRVSESENKDYELSYSYGSRDGHTVRSVNARGRYGRPEGREA